MNKIVNSVQLIGRLGADPEYKTLDSGQQLTKISLATREVYQNGKGEKVINTQWHNLVAWNKIAENMAVFLKKGHEVAIQGKLQNRSYEDKEGKKRIFTQIVVSDFMLFPKSSGKPIEKPTTAAMNH